VQIVQIVLVNWIKFMNLNMIRTGLR